MITRCLSNLFRLPDSSPSLASAFFRFRPEVASSTWRSGRLARTVATATLLLGSMASVQAGTFSGMHPLQTDRFIIGAGAYWMDISSDASLDKKGGLISGDVDFQDDLGFDDSDLQPALIAMWRITNHTRLEGEYFTVGQSNSSKLKETIEWDDVEYEVGAKVSANFDVDVGRLFFGYSFLKDDRKELGVGLGLHYLSIDAALKGEASVDGEPVGKVSHGIDDWAILPNLGIYGNYALSPKWLISARADWISANINDYDGTLWNAQAAIQYQLFDHFGLGLAYRYLSFDFEEDSSKRRWDIDVDYGGPILFFTANF